MSDYCSIGLVSIKGLENRGNHGITSKYTGRQTAGSFFPIASVASGDLRRYVFQGKLLPGKSRNFKSDTTLKVNFDAKY